MKEKQCLWIRWSTAINKTWQVIILPPFHQTVHKNSKRSINSIWADNPAIFFPFLTMFLKPGDACIVHIFAVFQLLGKSTTRYQLNLSLIKKTTGTAKYWHYEYIQFFQKEKKNYQHMLFNTSLTLQNSYNSLLSNYLKLGKDFKDFIHSRLAPTNRTIQSNLPGKQGDWCIKIQGINRS